MAKDGLNGVPLPELPRPRPEEGPEPSRGITYRMGYSACRLAGLSAVNHFIRSTRFMCGLGFVEPERVSTYRRGPSPLCGR
jgi:hypothetical protein